MLQSAVPTAQITPHAPPWHVARPGHAVLQVPQFVGSFWRLASQPSVGSSLQSVQPELHEPTVHAPFVQAAVALGTTQGAPQAPHCIGSFVMLTSQPLASLPSQFLKPLLHVPSAHAPAEHAAVPFAYGLQGAQDVGLQP